MTTQCPKTRVLFVDDEPMVLAGLRRMLRPLCAEWDMAFAGSGPQGLEMMEQQPFDVVVSDMRMPGMDGPQFLDEVMQRYPSTVRIVLSGQATQESRLKSVGPTHQFLAKPCDPDLLKRTVAGAIASQDLLADPTLRRLVSQMRSVPSLPSLYLEIQEALKDPECPLPRIGSIISRDAGMTAKILQLVNSAFFGLTRHVGTPGDAIFHLGLETVKALALGVGVFSSFGSAPLRKLGLGGLWDHSAATGAIAKKIARLHTRDSAVVDAALTGGLLHDLGKLVLAAGVAAEYGEALQRARHDRIAESEAEKDRFGATHADVGAYLAGLWALPPPLVEVLAHHHQPAGATTPGFCAVAAVHAANVLDHEARPREGFVQASLDEEYLGRLGLAGQIDEWRQLRDRDGGT